MRAVAATAIVFALVAITGSSAQQPAPAPAPAAGAPTAPAAPAPPTAERPPQAPRPVSPRQAPRPVTPAPGTAPAPAPLAAPAQPPGNPFVTVEPNQPGQLVNIQIDIALVSEGGTQGPARKTVTLTLADKQEGSVRSTDRGAGAPASLNVDARPVVQANGLILTRIGLEFQGGDDVPFVQVRAQPLLQSGRALRISRAVSPKTDRSVIVEVTATVLK
jgi:hypothetical protein